VVALWRRDKLSELANAMNTRQLSPQRHVTEIIVMASLGLQQSQRQAQLHTRLARAAITLAQQQAREVVKHQLRARGLKVQQIAHREITAMAWEYLAEHPELIGEAKPIIEQWRREGFFGKRAARAERNSQNQLSAESPANRSLPLNETLAQNGAP
jgi:hypothetical protein